MYYQNSKTELPMSNLKKTRKKAGVSQAALAERVGVTQGAIAHYELGRRTPSLEASRAIVKALNGFGLKCALDDVFPTAIAA
jgi:putative transcriptional regulator